MRFYGRFASAYGTMMLVVFVASILTQSHINLGMLGYYGFPLAALAYAVIRYAMEENPVLFARNAEQLHSLDDQTIKRNNS
ncbi:MAG: hypothetical protein IH987_10555 [Planctomycetes bacterium]|nr:hypothetical protein [Planctomycetota bacterium]